MSLEQLSQETIDSINEHDWNEDGSSKIISTIRRTRGVMESHGLSIILMDGKDNIPKNKDQHPELNYIIICGKEERGHQAGQALISLYENNINNNNTDSRTIIGAKGPHPILTSSWEDIMAFRKQIRRIYDLIGIDDIEQIKKQLISS